MNNPLNQVGNLTGQFRAPRTILGFFAALTAILGVTLFALVKIFADVEPLRAFIPLLLLFGGGFFSFIALAILITSWIKPERLMLGEVKGEVYLQMLQLRQGDSETGEIIEHISVSLPPGKLKTKTLPAKTIAKEDDSNV